MPGSNARWPSTYLSVFRNFSKFRPLVNVASACHSPLHFGFRRVFFTRFTSAFSSILKMLALIVATEIQLFLNENHVRSPFTGTRSGCTHREAPPGDYFNGILNTDLPDLPLIVPNIRLRHTSVKMARFTNFDRKGVQIFFTNKPLTLKMWLPCLAYNFSLLVHFNDLSVRWLHLFFDLIYC